MQPDYTGIAVRLRGSISDGWSGDAYAADANNAEEAAKVLIEARDTIADMLIALRAILQHNNKFGSSIPIPQIEMAQEAIAKATGEQS